MSSKVNFFTGREHMISFGNIRIGINIKHIRHQKSQFSCDIDMYLKKLN
jgi:hypothetical protein